MNLPPHGWNISGYPIPDVKIEILPMPCHGEVIAFVGAAAAKVFIKAVPA